MIFAIKWVPNKMSHVSDLTSKTTNAQKMVDMLNVLRGVVSFLSVTVTD